MEDCKCGRIPPCYSGRVFNIYEETKKVQEEWGALPGETYFVIKLGERL